MPCASRQNASRHAVKYLRGRPQPTRLFSTTAKHRALYNSPSINSVIGEYTPRVTPNHHAKDIGIIGGGISGLATAYNLSRDIPNAKITIYESKARFGGWIDTEIIETDEGRVVFEWGPRNIRPDTAGSGLAALLLLHELNESGADPVAERYTRNQSIVTIGKSQPAATNRFLYYPDHLVRMPGPNPTRSRIGNIVAGLTTMINEPIFDGVFSGVLKEPMKAIRTDRDKDESVGHFISRRYGKAVADNLVSALFHGIYAGDVYTLSARTLLPALWYLETRDSNSNGINAELMELFFRQQVLRTYSPLEFYNRYIHPVRSAAFLDFIKDTSRWSIYTFTTGLQHIVNLLMSRFGDGTQVALRSNTRVTSVDFDNAKRVGVLNLEEQGNPGSPPDRSQVRHDYIVNTLSSKTLSEMIRLDGGDEQLDQTLCRVNGFVNVMVVNLYYQNPDLIPAQFDGFGYLLPQSLPAAQNPERALGVIFGSSSSGARGSDVSEPGQDTALGTKLTVMIGGHWWRDWSRSDLPSEADGIEMAKSVLARHLSINERPLIAKAKMQFDAIPQYQVGYREDMADIHRGLSRRFSGRLKVLGTSWQGGVGVNDCIKRAREISTMIREGWDDDTGLEHYTKPEKWIIQDRQSGIMTLDSMNRP